MMHTMVGMLYIHNNLWISDCSAFDVSIHRGAGAPSPLVPTPLGNRKCWLS